MINLYETMLAQPEYFRQLSVKDVLVVYYKCPQKEKLVHLFTQHNYLLYCLNGKRKLHRQQDSWLLTKDISLFIKKTAYSQEWYEQQDWVVLAFFIPDHYLREVYAALRAELPVKKMLPPAGDCILQIHVNDITKAFFHSLLPYFDAATPPPDSLLEMKFRELFFTILCNPQNAPLLYYLNSLQADNRPRLDEIMEANYLYNLSLAEFAKLSQRSLSTFKRDFSSIYHTAPGKWLLEKRIAHAEWLLQTSPKNVNEIAFASGFESAAHFSRVFKEKFGNPPRRYRKTHRITEPQG